MFMSLFVIYGFDTASTLAEETNDPRRKAPQAVLASVAGAFVIGGIFLLATLMAIPNLRAAIKARLRGPAQIIDANFSKFWATVYLLVVSAAILVCCMCIMAATIRLCFGMARDNRLPLSARARQGAPPSAHARSGPASWWRSSRPSRCSSTRAPAYVAIAATGMIYLSYFLGNLAVMKARARAAGRR